MKYWHTKLQGTITRDWSLWLDHAIVESSGSAAHKMVEKKVSGPAMVARAGEVHVQQKMWQKIWTRDIKKMN